MKTESQTRKDLIDTKLFSAGWDVNNLSQVLQEFDISVPLTEGVGEPRTPCEGHQLSDYVLLGRDRKPLVTVDLPNKLPENCSDFNRKFSPVFMANYPDQSNIEGTSCYGC